MGHIEVYVGSSVDYTGTVVNLICIFICGPFGKHLACGISLLKTISTTPMAVISVSDYQTIGYVKHF